MTENLPVTEHGKRFFTINDDGNRYYFVARDDAHVRLLLEDVEFGDPSRPFAEYRDRDGDPLLIREVDAERAATIRCHTEDDDRGRGTIPLAECDLGEWFSSAY